MRCRNYVSHYIKDAELFDYFETQSGPDADGARRIQEAVQRELSRLRPRLLLDAGSGNGWVAKRNSTVRGHIVSCDISVKNLRRIREEVPADALYVAADAHHLPFRENVFDTLIASEMLEHVNTPGAVLSELYRVSGAGATIIISTPYRETIRLSLCIHCNQLTPSNAHLHSFDDAALRGILERSGWSVRRHEIFQSRLFISLRLSYLLRFFPYLLWRYLDNLFLFFSGKAHTIILTAAKADSRPI